MSRFTVVLDACVLYPALLRDVLVTLATTGLFSAKWTDAIHDEWIENLLERRPEIGREKLEKTRSQMNDAVLDCLVSGYESLIDGIVDLPDPKDKHVVAAAIKCRADAIVTTNLKHFPDDLLDTTYGIEVLHPDDFVVAQIGLDLNVVLNAVREMRERRKNPPWSATDLLERLSRQSLHKTASELAGYLHDI